MNITGVTLERTSIRSTPGGDTIIGSIPKDTPITANDGLGSWMKLITINGVPKGGYVNSRSIKITAVITEPPPDTPPPPPPTTNPKVLRTIQILDDFKFIIDGIPE